MDSARGTIYVIIISKNLHSVIYILNCVFCSLQIFLSLNSVTKYLELNTNKDPYLKLSLCLIV